MTEWAFILYLFMQGHSAHIEVPGKFKTIEECKVALKWTIQTNDTGTIPYIKNGICVPTPVTNK